LASPTRRELAVTEKASNPAARCVELGLLDVLASQRLCQRLAGEVTQAVVLADLTAQPGQRRAAAAFAADRLHVDEAGMGGAQATLNRSS
jgi:hypothetical protein